jgi:cytochrome c-type biogenesis protein CcmH
MIALVLALFLQLKVPDAQQVVGEPKGTPVTGADLDRRTQEVASLIRCPVCQGLAIADSPSAMALNMKEQVRELLARGFTQEQILSYFEQSYGQFVLLKPKFRGVNSLVWLLPIAVLAFGVLIVYSKNRKLGQAPAPAAAAAEKSAPSDDPYLARVRELVEKE